MHDWYYYHGGNGYGFPAFAEWYNTLYDSDLPITGENFVTFDYWREARYPEDWNIEEFPDFDAWYGAPQEFPDFATWQEERATAIAAE